MTYTNRTKLSFTEKALFVLLCMSIAPEIVRFFRALSMRLPGLEDITYFTDIILFSGVALFALPAFIKRCRFSDYMFVGVVYFIYVLTYLLFPENEQGLNFYLPTFFFTVVPAYFIGRVINFKFYSDIFYKVSIVAIVLSAFYYLYFARMKYGAMDSNEEIMSAAYAILPNILLVLWKAFEKPNIVNVPTVLISVFLLLSFGTRGPVVCLILYIVFYFVLIKQWNKNILILGIIALVVFFLISYIDIILLYLYDLMYSVGVSTRVLDLFSNENMFVSQGRDDLNDLVLSRIHESNGSPYGIAALSRWTDTYPHNLALQLWLEFGVLLGSVLLLSLVVLIVVAYFKTKDSSERVFLLVLFIIGFVHLFLSHTYLTVSWTFMLVGYSIYIINHNKKRMAK